ncbi:hypothetical protein RJT34_20422 [Clitoria ternatea]|uniref:Carbonic anhydrase n=1 Tax=Clitoria ternatea TaxID=43366 RepID=A0AAN9ISS7_CLITE
MTLFSLLLLLLFILHSSSFLTLAEDEYTYAEGTSNGPENWRNLNPKWKVCGDGKLQSPIDIQLKGVMELPQLGKLEKHYKPAPAVLKNRGHDIMLQWSGDAGRFNINGTYYSLKQCHWHTPSEHKLNARKFDMELHMLHQNSQGEVAVISICYEIGCPDPFLSKLLKDIKSIGDKDIDIGVINPETIKFGKGKYYRYVGSITTPPCTEGVTWTVMKKVRKVSKEQLEVLKGAVHHGYEENARPTQEVGERQVWLYTKK